MRRSSLWGLGLTLFIGLSAAAGRAWADDDEPGTGPRAHYARGPGLMDRLFQPSDKPAPKKPAKKAADAPAKDKVEKPAVDSPAAIRAREQAAYERRTQVCLRLMDLANQQNDEELFRRAEELDKRAWAVYLQRTAHLPAGNIAGESDEEVLDRHLGNKTAAAANEGDLKSGAAKGNDRNTSQAAVREVKP